MANFWQIFGKFWRRACGCAAAALLSASFCGCKSLKSREFVAHEADTMRARSELRQQILVDSVFQIDSIRIIERGCSVILQQRTITRELVRDVRRDTIRDTIQTAARDFQQTKRVVQKENWLFINGIAVVVFAAIFMLYNMFRQKS